VLIHKTRWHLSIDAGWALGETQAALGPFTTEQVELIQLTGQEPKFPVLPTHWPVRDLPSGTHSAATCGVKTWIGGDQDAATEAGPRQHG
jgi:hypothetical protein